MGGKSFFLDEECKLVGQRGHKQLTQPDSYDWDGWSKYAHNIEAELEKLDLEEQAQEEQLKIKATKMDRDVERRRKKR